MVDTHCHLDVCEPPDDELVARAAAAGVRRLATVGLNEASAERALAAARAHDGVVAIVGRHPNEAGGFSDRDMDAIERCARDEHVRAVGETGLDYYRDYAPRECQRELFRAQGELAAELGKALVVHSRAADEDTAAILADIADGIPVVLHCFSSTRLLEPALERRYYFSFAGNVTYPKAPELRWAAAQTPADRLLAETDSPYLAPQPVRGRRNEPAHVVHTLAALAEARGEDPRELERTIERNATAAFGLP